MLESGETGRPTPQVYQNDSVWWVVTVVALVCGVISLGMAGWYYLSTRSTNNRITDLQSTSVNLDTQIAAANKSANGDIEKRSTLLLSEVKTFQSILAGKKQWGKIIPAVAASTLNGVSVTGFSVDKNLGIHIDGTAVPTDGLTSFGLIARQVVLFENATATLTPASNSTTSSTPTTVKEFSSVALVSISRKGTLVAPSRGASKDADLGHFTITMTFNSALVAPAPIVSVTSGGTQ